MLWLTAMQLSLQHVHPAGQAQLLRSRQTARRAFVCPPQAAAQTENKTSVRQPRPENVSGDFYVDHTCIGALCCFPALHLRRDQPVQTCAV